MLGTIDIVLVTQDADGHVGAGHRGQLDGARETLVTLRVIVLETDLELDSLEEVALLGLGSYGRITVSISWLLKMAMSLGGGVVLGLAMALVTAKGSRNLGWTDSTQGVR